MKNVCSYYGIILFSLVHTTFSSSVADGLPEESTAFIVPASLVFLFALVFLIFSCAGCYESEVSSTTHAACGGSGRNYDYAPVNTTSSVNENVYNSGFSAAGQVPQRVTDGYTSQATQLPYGLTPVQPYGTPYQAPVGADQPTAPPSSPGINTWSAPAQQAAGGGWVAPPQTTTGWSAPSAQAAGGGWSAPSPQALGGGWATQPSQQSYGEAGQSPPRQPQSQGQGQPDFPEQPPSYNEAMQEERQHYQR